jgi:hypothetical protein
MSKPVQIVVIPAAELDRREGSDDDRLYVLWDDGAITRALWNPDQKEWTWEEVFGGPDEDAT